MPLMLFSAPQLLFEKCSALKGDFIMAYDNSDDVISLAQKHNLEFKTIPMKNTHHAKLTELVIGRDLTWDRRAR